MITRDTWAALVLLLVTTHQDCVAEKLAVGSGNFVFVDAEGNGDRPITVWFHRPARFRSTGPVVFVMHGVDRNGRVYRDVWAKQADARGFLLLVPEFSNEHYSSARHYNHGYMRESDGRLRDRSKWSFMAVERLFDRVVADNDFKQEQYTIYGHSAGAQFVHRFVTMVPEARIKLAIAANAGWYTMPLLDVAYPYGLQGMDVSEPELRQVLAKRLVVLLGTDDTDPNHRHLTKTPEAMEQGPHRLARGKNYFATARQQAKELETDFGWRLQTVRGVGHSNSKMSEAAVKLIR